ncbi:DNA translocase FtsK [Nitrospirillum iridis]|uniref:DNA translocase FtsK n=1 Tax=Nitrospirillum iridis TaxID=765888 RepID=A0A7X0EFP1_9PROT|nr:DNA translocase FtsK [Nitrospirillum iridis]MBB6252689.1 S-DNA-T family DNA segregation ATPase FtsK/SpoIIIE [Nitrospirillum iridis]
MTTRLASTPGSRGSRDPLSSGQGSAGSRSGPTGPGKRRRGSLLPDGASQFLLRRAAEVGGLCVVLLALALAAVLFSYDPNDPSLNTAGPHGAVHNVAGVIGSYAADVLVQCFGLAAYLLAVIIAGWGARILRHDPPSFWAGRLAAGLIAVILAGVSLGGISAPFDGGAGGNVGRVLVTLTDHFFIAHLGWGSPLLLGLVTALATMALIVVALGVPFYQAFAAVGAAYGFVRRIGQWRPAAKPAAPASVRRPNQPVYDEPEDHADDPVGEEAPAGLAGRLRSAAGSALAGVGGLGGLAGSLTDRLTGGLKGLSARERAAPAPRREPGFGDGLRREPSLSIPPLDRPGDRPAERPEPRAGELAVEGEAAPRRPLATVVPPKAKPVEIARKAPAALQSSLDLEPDGPSDYELPPVELLQLPDLSVRSPGVNEEALRQNAQLLEGVLDDFGVKGEIGKVHPGPVVTLYELEPAPGTKSSRVIGLADDIARSMSAVSVRVAVVPGRNVIGVELPNAKRETVYLRELLEAESYDRAQHKLALVLGKDIGGQPVIADLARMPHLLVAGTTGSGKSVAINTMILSLLYRLPPEKCRFIMVDPKMLELSIYEGIPHLLAPVVTDPKKAVVALKWTVREMEDRYRAMSKLGVRNIDGYNIRLREARQNGETLTRRIQTGFDPDTGKPVFEDQPIDLTELPYIVVIVDEMADLMLVAGKDIEAAIQRLAQMARAAGIHIIMATQRPSVDVITGTIKANFPTRISFQVTSKIDSRTILGEQGAEQLLGQGDMLYMAGGGRITRVHGPFVRDQEVEDVVKFLKAQGEPNYVDAVTEEDEASPFDEDGGSGGGSGGNTSSGDELYDQAVAVVCREGKASTSFIQRHLRIGYNSAARLIERMEQEGVVSRANHVGKREVLARNIDDRES